MRRETFLQAISELSKKVTFVTSILWERLLKYRRILYLWERQLVNQQPEWTPPTDQRIPLPSLNRRIIFNIFLYFVGVFIAAFGLTGTIIVVNSTFVGASIAICLGLASLLSGIIVFSRTYQYFQGLNWLQYIVWILGVTIVLCITFLLWNATMYNRGDKYPYRYLQGILFYSIFIFCGFTLIWLAYKKPPLSQQVDESIRSIVKAMPNKQIFASELVVRLQRMYHLSEEILYQQIEQLQDIEQVDIPGTNTKVVLMRDKKQRLAFPQVATITNPTLRASIERALLDLTEESVDIGLFLLGREFETTLKVYLVAAYAKGKLKSVPGNRIPGKDRLSLNEMISCLKINDIVTDDAVLSYLRQTRNDRAHGSTPSLVERQLQMKNIQLLAGLYIDYIKWLDDLTHSLYT